MRVRFSIAGLMAVVLIFAVGFAGLRAASPLWASGVFSITVTLLAASILGAAARRGPSQMAWLGFAVFGWTYLLATFWLWPERNGVIAPPFLTKALLDYSRPPVYNSTMMTLDPGPTGEGSVVYVPMLGMRGGTMIPAGLPAGPPPGMRVINLLHYRRIGHTLATIVFGLLGALLGTLFGSRSKGAGGQSPL